MAHLAHSSKAKDQSLNQLVYLHWLNLAPSIQYQVHKSKKTLKLSAFQDACRCMAVILMVLTIPDVVLEETKLLLPGCKIIIGRMYVEHPKFTKIWKKCILSALQRQ